MKASKNRLDGFEGVIRNTIREVVNFNKCSAWEWEDFEQELILHLLKTKAKFDNEDDFRYAVKSIVRNKLINLEKWRHREKRNHFLIASIEEKVSITADKTHLDVIKDETFDPPDKITENKPTVWKVVEGKSDFYKELLRLMLKHHEVAAVARVMGKPRATISYHWDKLKKWINDAGLKK